MIVAGVVYYLLSSPNQNKSNANSGVNSTVNFNQNKTAVNDETLSTNSNASPAGASLAQYHNNAFGYTVDYNAYASADPATLRSTWDIQNPAESLYSEWGLSEGDQTVIAVSVYDSAGRDAVFESKKYTTVSETEQLNSEIAASYIKVDGEVRGYQFIQANYLFVLSTTYSVGSAGYDEFKTITKSLTFALQPE